MLLTCNTLLFGGMPLADALAHVAWAGYTRVELSATKNAGEHLTPELSTSRVAEIRQLLAGHRLEAVAMETGLQLDRLASLLPIAAEIGISVVTTSSGGTTGDEASFVQAIEMIGQAARLAGTYGLRLAVKPHVGFAVFDTPTALRLIAEVREPALGLNFDPSHLYRAGDDPAAVASTWGNRTIACHFRDCATRDTRVGSPETQIPGRGAIDVFATLSALHRAGFCGPLTLQVVGARDYEPARATAVAAEGRGYLHRCLQELAVAV